MGNMLTKPFELTRPDTNRTCAIFASPHSGRDYGAEFLALSVLSEAEIRSSEDAYVDELFADVPSFGAPLLCATAPRAYLDLNRSTKDIDPALVKGVTRPALNSRVASGLGIVPRVVANGRAIYRGKIDLADAQNRIGWIWHPYHGQLQSLMDQSHVNFGRAMLIDCHSMPHEAIERSVNAGQPKPQIVLGDRFGAAASRAIVDQIEASFVAAGFRVARNTPFAGAYIAQHYGRPSRHQHVVQIEIDRSLYMDEATLKKHAGFDELRARLRPIIADIAQLGSGDQLQIAAE